MKRITTLFVAFIGMASMNQALATHVKVDIRTAGQLSTLVENTACDSLTISGNMNSDDFSFLRNKIPNLVYLDMTKVALTDNKIPNSALQSKETLQEVILPQNLETVGEYAFDRCYDLKKVVFPETLRTLMYEAFSECPISDGLILPQKVAYIGVRAFDYLEADEITLPDSLKDIDSEAFRYSKISKINFPDSLKTIGNYAFNNCQQLQQLTFNKDIQSIGNNAFSECFRLHTATLKSIVPPSIFDNSFNYTKVFFVPQGTAKDYKEATYWSNKIIIDGDEPKKVTVTLTTAGTLGEEILKQVDYVTDVNELVVSGPLNEDDFYQIQQRATNLIAIDMTGSTIEVLPEHFFSERSAILDIKLPATLKDIGNYAFYRCYGLTRITVPEGVTSIGEYTFSNCYSLKNIELPTSLTNIGSYALQNCSSLKTVNIPDNVTNISYAAIADCAILQEVKFPANLKTISTYAFSQCPLLDNIILPEGLTDIGDYAFQLCSSLKSITLPSTLTRLGYLSFYRCPSITEITLPATLTYCHQPFQECHNIKKVTCLASVPPTLYNNYDILYDVDKSNTELLVPFWSVNSYKLAKGWDAFPNISALDYETDLINVPGELVIAEDIRFQNNPTVYVSGNGKLTVRGTDPLSMKKYIQCHALSGYNNDNYWSYQNPVYTNLLSESGAMRADSVVYQLDLKRDYWQFITLPFDVKVSEIELDNDALYVIRYYDGKARAEGSTSNWKDVPADGTLQAGTGYIVQANKQTRMTLKAINNDNKNRLFSGNTLTKALNEYASEFAHNASWNFLGNPYPCYFDIYYLDYTAPLTLWDTQNRTYTAVTPSDDDYILNPMQAFFIQKPVGTEAISFTAEGRQMDTAIRQRATTRSAVSPDRTVFNFTLSDGQSTDRTRVVINPEASMDYEMSCDAAKFMSDDQTVPQIFTLDNQGKYYAINERPLNDGVVSVGFYAGAKGNYTLSLADASATADEVTLIDKQTGSQTRLDQESYTFTTEAGLYSERFELRLKTRTMTGLEEHENAKTARVWAEAGQIVIIAQPGSEMMACNINGQVIARQTLTQGNTTLSVVPGVYVVNIGKETFKIMVNK